MTNWYEGPFLGFDLETTGVDPANDRLVTAGLVRWDNGNLQEVEYLADPGVEIPEEATNVHGFTTEYAREHGEPLRDVVIKVRKALADAIETNVPIVIFNAQFDLPMIDAHLEREGLPRLADEFKFIPVLDPLVLDRTMDRRRKGSRKLADQAVAYGISADETLHEALADVRLTLKLLLAILDKYPRLKELSLESIKRFQLAGHYRWAASFRQYLTRCGKDASGVRLQWV